MRAGKIKLIFDMGDEDERVACNDAMQATGMALFIYEFEQEIRKIWKYEQMPDEVFNMVERIRNKWYELKQDRGISDE